MSKTNKLSSLLSVAAIAGAVLLGSQAVHAQIVGHPDVDTSQKTGDDSECAIAINPTNKNQVFLACNNTGSGGLFAARSTDRGLNWSYPDPADKTIADGDAGQGPAACCDPSLSWDSFGNLFLTYIDSGVGNIVTLVSTDGGATFATLVQFPGSVDQPTVVAASGAVWVVWNQSGQMVARGAPVTGLGSANIGAFNALQTIPGTANCSFGDIAIAPSGAVVQACETPTSGQGPASILVNTDSDGLGAGNFGAAVTATTTNVGGFDFITPQNARSVDAEAGLAYDSNPASPHFGRLYLVYTEEPVDESNNTTILMRFSDNDGATWSAPVNVDTDLSNHARFLPKIAANSDSGNVAICWHDTKGSAGNNQMRVFCTAFNRLDATPTFQPSTQIGDGFSLSNGAGIEFGDYSGLAYFKGVFEPAWADTSNSTGNNPNGTANFDAYVDWASWNPLANEGDPHIHTADGGFYNFQGAGEFTALRDDTGLDIQTRQSPTSTFGPYFDSHTGLTTCVSLNTALAARVGKHRVTYEPNYKDSSPQNGLELRIDGVLTTLPAGGLSLGGGGHISPLVNGAIEVDFPDGTVLIATPYWASPQWFLNVDVYRTAATDGIMGSFARGSWLPALPNGSSVGAMPATLHQRYVTLNQTYANAWRVTNASSLFDYAPGTSTATFTFTGWPGESGDCKVPTQPPPAEPIDPRKAEEICGQVADRARHANCVFDVAVTGRPEFAKAYLLTERIHTGATVIRLTDNWGPINEQLTKPLPYLIAKVSRLVAGGRAPVGAVEFTLDGRQVAEPVPLDEEGIARVKVPDLKPGRHVASAVYIPNKDSVFLRSASPEKILEFGATGR